MRTLEPAVNRSSSNNSILPKPGLKNLFSSTDFGKFLSKELPAIGGFTNPSVFLSKDAPLPPFDSSNIFRSKDSFSSMFSSKDWDMKFPTVDTKRTESLPPLKTIMTNTRKRSMSSNASASSVILPPLNFNVPSSPERAPVRANSTASSSSTSTIESSIMPTQALSGNFTSRDWLPLKTLGNHIDIQIRDDLFDRSSDSSVVSVAPQENVLDVLPPIGSNVAGGKTDWDSMFLSDLQPLSSSSSPASSYNEAETAVADPDPPDQEASEMHPFTTQPQQQTVVLVAETVPSSSLATMPVYQEDDDNEHVEEALTSPRAASGTTTRIRKRRPRKKVVPDVKVYVAPVDEDVLLGRGGRSNHHPGNKRYREEVENLRSWYMGTDDKNQKTDLSQMLVDYVHSYNGRFLEKDGDRWYIVPNIVARRKASQALREDNDAEKRAAKRARYLEKKRLTAQQGRAA